jgi:hypothetical protein
MAANDTDPDGNLKDGDGNVSAGQFTIVTPPTHRGKVVLVTNGVKYTPRKNFTGTEIVHLHGERSRWGRIQRGHCHGQRDPVVFHDKTACDPPVQ